MYAMTVLSEETRKRFLDMYNTLSIEQIEEAQALGEKVIDRKLSKSEVDLKTFYGEYLFEAIGKKELGQLTRTTLWDLGFEKPSFRDGIGLGLCQETFQDQNNSAFGGPLGKRYFIGVILEREDEQTKKTEEVFRLVYFIKAGLKLLEFSRRGIQMETFIDCLGKKSQREPLWQLKDLLAGERVGEYTLRAPKNQSAAASSSQ